MLPTRASRFIFLFLLLIAHPVWSQDQNTGSISGTVVETSSGEPLSGVVVTVRGTTLGTQTDPSGRYRLEGVPPGTHELRMVKSGYERASVPNVAVVAGQTTRADARIAPEYYEAETFEVIAEPVEDQVAIILEERKTASMISDAIGSDMFKNLAVGDAAQALSKVTGATVAEGKYAVIRGLADRYTYTTLNGTELPSADPDRKAFQLDLLPSDFIERLDIAKTFTPDMNGGFAGGSVDIIPKRYPDRELFKFRTGVSYNTQASLRDDYLVNDRGSTDWLARDDGTRELPADAAAQPQRGTPIPDQSFANSFGSRWFSPERGDSYVNGSLSLTYGNSHPLFAGRVGYLVSLSYKNEYNFYDNGEINHYHPAFFSPDGTSQDAKKTDMHAVTEYTWAALANLGYEINDNHDIGFTFMHVQTAEDEARIVQGYEEAPLNDVSKEYLDQRIIHWTERKLDYLQLRGGHEIPDFDDIRLDWAGSLSSTSQEEPDQRIFQFVANPIDENYVIKGPLKPKFPVRFWRDIQEENQNFRADLTIPLPSYNEKENFVKTGAALSRSARDFSQRSFQITPEDENLFYDTGDPQDYLDPANFVDPASAIYENYAANVEYHGEQAVDGFYGMAEWSAFNWLKLTGGARLETTEITLDGFDNTRGTPLRPASIQSDDVLPSLSGAFSLRENLQLRAAWSETVVRPTYREIGQVELYDVARTRVYIGNPDLKISHSQNFDLRLDWYPRDGEIASVSFFHKVIDSPIEQFATINDNSQITYQNFDEAKVNGVEVEARFGLDRVWKPLESLTLGFNGAYIQSEVPLTAAQITNRHQNYGSTETKRPLYDQPEYVLNADLTWNVKSWNTTVTLSGGVVGKRLTVVGLGSPDEYLAPSPELNLFIRQKIGKNWDIRFTAKNLLNPKIETVQAWPRAGEKVLTSYTKGVTLGLSIGYEF